jgi:hypothetical protein
MSEKLEKKGKAEHRIRLKKAKEYIKKLRKERRNFCVGKSKL